jgi:hypothetical protein
MVAGRAPRFDPAPFAPERFGARAGDEAWLKREVSSAPSRSYLAANL